MRSHAIASLRNYRGQILELGVSTVNFHSLTDKLMSAVRLDGSKQRLDYPLLA